MRKTKIVTITAEGRDKGKTFFITEMSARQAEQWAARAFLALAHSRVDLPPGPPGIVEVIHLYSNVQFPEIEPLMEELLGCIQFVWETKPTTLMRPLVDNGAEGDDIEEVETRQLLRREVMNLHVNFLLAAKMLEVIARASTLTELPDTETIQTSRSQLGSSSAPV